MPTQNQEEIDKLDARAKRFLDCESEIHSSESMSQSVFEQTANNGIVRCAEITDIASVSWSELSEYEKQFVRKKTAELDDELLLPNDEREYIYLSVSPTISTSGASRTILLPVFWDQDLYEQSDLAELLDSVDGEKHEFSKLYQRQITIAKKEGYDFWVPVFLDDLEKMLLKYDLAEWDSDSVTPVGLGKYYTRLTVLVPTVFLATPILSTPFVPLEALMILGPVLVMIPFLAMSVIEESAILDRFYAQLLEKLVEKFH